MRFECTNVDGAILIRQQPFTDERGYFSRIFCEKAFRENGLPHKFVQSNLCQNKAAGTLRGLHTSIEGYEEDKLVTCTRGRVFDVCADTRVHSPTYGQYAECELSESNGNMLFIPKGCAHGYITLEADCQLLYFMSEFYVPSTTAGYRYDDPFFSIKWPFEEPLILSEQDANWPYIENTAQEGF